MPDTPNAPDLDEAPTIETFAPETPHPPSSNMLTINTPKKLTRKLSEDDAASAAAAKTLDEEEKSLQMSLDKWRFDTASHIKKLEVGKFNNLAQHCIVGLWKLTKYNVANDKIHENNSR